MSVATAFSAEAVQDVVDPALERRRAVLNSSPSSDDDHSAVRGDFRSPFSPTSRGPVSRSGSSSGDGTVMHAEAARWRTRAEQLERRVRELAASSHVLEEDLNRVAGERKEFSKSNKRLRSDLHTAHLEAHAMREAFDAEMVALRLEIAALEEKIQRDAAVRYADAGGLGPGAQLFTPPRTRGNLDAIHTPPRASAFLSSIPTPTKTLVKRQLDMGRAGTLERELVAQQSFLLATEVAAERAAHELTQKRLSELLAANVALVRDQETVSAEDEARAAAVTDAVASVEAHAVRVEAECANLRESLARESEVAAARIADLTQALEQRDHRVADLRQSLASALGLLEANRVAIPGTIVDVSSRSAPDGPFLAWEQTVEEACDRFRAAQAEVTQAKDTIKTLEATVRSLTDQLASKEALHEAQVSGLSDRIAELEASEIHEQKMVASLSEELDRAYKRQNAAIQAEESALAERDHALNQVAEARRAAEALSTSNATAVADLAAVREAARRAEEQHRVDQEATNARVSAVIASMEQKMGEQAEAVVAAHSISNGESAAVAALEAQLAETRAQLLATTESLGAVSSLRVQQVAVLERQVEAAVGQATACGDRVTLLEETNASLCVTVDRLRDAFLPLRDALEASERDLSGARALLFASEQRGQASEDAVEALAAETSALRQTVADLASQLREAEDLAAESRADSRVATARVRDLEDAAAAALARAEAAERAIDRSLSHRDLASLSSLESQIASALDANERDFDTWLASLDRIHTSLGAHAEAIESFHRRSDGATVELSPSPSPLRGDHDRDLSSGDGECKSDVPGQSRLSMVNQIWVLTSVNSDLVARLAARFEREEVLCASLDAAMSAVMRLGVEHRAALDTIALLEREADALGQSQREANASVDTLSADLRSAVVALDLSSRRANLLESAFAAGPPANHPSALAASSNAPPAGDGFKDRATALLIESMSPIGQARANLHEAAALDRAARGGMDPPLMAHDLGALMEEAAADGESASGDDLGNDGAAFDDGGDNPSQVDQSASLDETRMRLKAALASEADVRAELSFVSSEVAQTRREAASARGLVESLQGRVSELEQELAKSQARADAYETAMAAAAAGQGGVHQAREAAFDALRDEASTLRAEAHAASGRAAGLETSLERATAAAQAANERVSELETVVADMRVEAGVLQERLAAREAQILQSETDRKQAVEQLAASTARVEALETAVSAASARVLEAEARAKVAVEATAEADLRASAARQRVNSLLAQVQSDVGSQTAEAKAARERCAALAAQLTASEDRAATATALVASLEADIEARASKEATLEGDLQAANGACNRLRRDVSDALDRAVAAEGHHLEARAARDRLEAQVAALSQRVDDVDDARAEVVRDLGEAQAANADLAARMAALENDLASSRASVAELEAEATIAATSLAKLREEAEAWATAVEAGNQREASLRRDLATATAEVTAAGEELERATAVTLQRQAEHNDRVTRLETALATAEARLATASGGGSGSDAAVALAAALMSQNNKPPRNSSETDLLDLLREQLADARASSAQLRADRDAAQAKLEQALRETAEARAERSAAIPLQAGEAGMGTELVQSLDRLVARVESAVSHQQSAGRGSEDSDRLALISLIESVSQQQAALHQALVDRDRAARDDRPLDQSAQESARLLQRADQRQRDLEAENDRVRRQADASQSEVRRLTNELRNAQAELEVTRDDSTRLERRMRALRDEQAAAEAAAAGGLGGGGATVGTRMSALARERDEAVAAAERLRAEASDLRDKVRAAEAASAMLQARLGEARVRADNAATALRSEQRAREQAEAQLSTEATAGRAAAAELDRLTRQLQVATTHAKESEDQRARDRRALERAESEAEELKQRLARAKAAQTEAIETAARDARVHREHVDDAERRVRDLEHRLQRASSTEIAAAAAAVEPTTPAPLGGIHDACRTREAQLVAELAVETRAGANADRDLDRAMASEREALADVRRLTDRVRELEGAVLAAQLQCQQAEVAGQLAREQRLTQGDQSQAGKAEVEALRARANAAEQTQVNVERRLASAEGRAAALSSALDEERKLTARLTQALDVMERERSAAGRDRAELAAALSSARLHSESNSVAAADRQAAIQSQAAMVESLMAMLSSEREAARSAAAAAAAVSREPAASPVPTLTADDVADAIRRVTEEVEASVALSKAQEAAETAKLAAAQTEAAASARLQAMSDKVTSLERRLGEAHAQIGALASDLKVAQSGEADATQAAQAVSTQLSDAEKRASETGAALRAANQRVSSLEEEVAALRSGRSRLEGEIERLTAVDGATVLRALRTHLNARIAVVGSKSEPVALLAVGDAQVDGMIDDLVASVAAAVGDAARTARIEVKTQSKAALNDAIAAARADAAAEVAALRQELQTAVAQSAELEACLAVMSARSSAADKQSLTERQASVWADRCRALAGKCQTLVESTKRGVRKQVAAQEARDRDAADRIALLKTERDEALQEGRTATERARAAEADRDLVTVQLSKAQAEMEALSSSAAEARSARDALEAAVAASKEEYRRLQAEARQRVEDGARKLSAARREVRQWKAAARQAEDMLTLRNRTVERLRAQGEVQAGLVKEAEAAMAASRSATESEFRAAKAMYVAAKAEAGRLQDALIAAEDEAGELKSKIAALEANLAFSRDLASEIDAQRLAACGEVERLEAALAMAEAAIEAAAVARRSAEEATTREAERRLAAERALETVIEQRTAAEARAEATVDDLTRRLAFASEAAQAAARACEAAEGVASRESNRANQLASVVEAMTLKAESLGAEAEAATAALEAERCALEDVQSRLEAASAEAAEARAKCEAQRADASAAVMLHRVEVERLTLRVGALAEKRDALLETLGNAEEARDAALVNAAAGTHQIATLTKERDRLAAKAVNIEARQAAAVEAHRDSVAAMEGRLQEAEGENDRLTAEVARLNAWLEEVNGAFGDADADRDNESVISAEGEDANDESVNKSVLGTQLAILSAELDAVLQARDEAQAEMKAVRDVHDATVAELETTIESLELTLAISEEARMEALAALEAARADGAVEAPHPITTVDVAAQASEADIEAAMAASAAWPGTPVNIKAEKRRIVMDLERKIAHEARALDRDRSFEPSGSVSPIQAALFGEPSSPPPRDHSPFGAVPFLSASTPASDRGRVADLEAALAARSARISALENEVEAGRTALGEREAKYAALAADLQSLAGHLDVVLAERDEAVAEVRFLRRALLEVDDGSWVDASGSHRHGPGDGNGPASGAPAAIAVVGEEASRGGDLSSSGSRRSYDSACGLCAATSAREDELRAFLEAALRERDELEGRVRSLHAATRNAVDRAEVAYVSEVLAEIDALARSELVASSVGVGTGTRRSARDRSPVSDENASDDDEATLALSALHNTRAALAVLRDEQARAVADASRLERERDLLAAELTANRWVLDGSAAASWKADKSALAVSDLEFDAVDHHLTSAPHLHSPAARKQLASAIAVVMAADSSRDDDHRGGHGKASVALEVARSTLVQFCDALRGDDGKENAPSRDRRTAMAP